MDSAIEISSGSSSSSSSDSGSDDEVSEPTRTRSNTAWLYGSRSFPQKGSSEVHTQASGSGAPSQPRRDCTKLTVAESNVSGVDNERRRTLPPSFNSPPAIGNKSTTQASRIGAPPSYLPRDSTTFTRNDENGIGSSFSRVDDKKLPAQQAMGRTLPPSFNPSPNTSRNVGDYSSPGVGNKNAF